MSWTTFSLLLLLLAIGVHSDDVTTEGNSEDETGTTPKNLQDETTNPAEFQNNTKQPFVGRYFKHSKIYNTSFETNMKHLENGTKLVEKKTKSEIIEITTHVPDNENFVVSKIVYFVYSRLMNQLNAHNSRNRTLTMLASMEKILHGEFKNGKLLTNETKNILKKQYKIVKNMNFAMSSGQKNVSDSELKAYLERLLHEISSTPMPPQTKTLLFSQVDELISNETNKKTIDGKKEYTGLLTNILRNLLQNELNRTIIDEIDENCDKAFEMNKHVQTTLKDKIFKMVIRALSQLDYRIVYNKHISKHSENNIEVCPKKVKNVDPDERCNLMYVTLIEEYEVTNKDILAEVIKKYWTNRREDTETKDYIWTKYQILLRKARENKSSKLIEVKSEVVEEKREVVEEKREVVEEKREVVEEKREAVEEKREGLPIIIQAIEKSAKKEIEANILKTTIRKRLECNNGSCSSVKLEDQIKTIIIQAIEYQKTKDKLQSLYGEHIVKTLREGDREKVKKGLIEKYLNITDKPVETKPFKINKTDANLIENFEKDLLNTIIIDERQVRVDPKITAKLTEILSEKELGTTKYGSYFLVKTIIQELGYTVDGEEACNANHDCIESTKQLHEQFRRNDNIKYFGKYLERKLYDIKFATNLIHDKSDKAVHLYKTFESEYENSNCIQDLRNALVNKIQLYQKILRYSSLLKEWKGEERCACSNERKIVFNRNPIRNNTVIYRQNEFDMGYAISLSEPNKLIDASIITYINVNNRNSTLVKETINNQPYINLGDTLPGELISYTTILKLEFMNKMNRDITVKLGLEDKVVHTSFIIDLQLLGGVHVKGLIRPNGPRKQKDNLTNPDDMKVKWKVLNVREDKFELRPDLSEVEDLEKCSGYFHGID